MFKSLFILRERERERERMGEGRSEREIDIIPSRLCTVRAEPNVGLRPTKREIMTWAEINQLTSWTLNQLSFPGTPIKLLFYKKNIHEAHKLFSKYSTLLVIKKIPIKNQWNDSIRLPQWLKQTSQEIPKCCQRWRVTETFICHSWECKLVQTLWKRFQSTYSSKTCVIPYGPLYP